MIALLFVDLAGFDDFVLSALHDLLTRIVRMSFNSCLEILYALFLTSHLAIERNICAKLF